MRRVVLAAALLALLAIGCKAEINVEVQLEPDGSGVLIAETGFDEEFQEFAFQDADPEEAIFEDNDLADLPDAEFLTYEEGEFTFYQVKVPFDDVAEVLNQAGEGAPLEGVQVEISDDEVRVSASTEQATDAIFESDDLEGFDPEILADTFSIHIRLLMPGEVTSHNADRVLDDGTLEWDVPLSGAAVNIEAVSDPTGGGGDGVPLWLIGALVGGAAVVGGGVYVMRRRRGDEPAREPAPVTAGTPEGTVGAGTTMEVPPPPPPPVLPPAEAILPDVPPSAAPIVEQIDGDGDAEEEPPPIT